MCLLPVFDGVDHRRPGCFQLTDAFDPTEPKRPVNYEAMVELQTYIFHSFYRDSSQVITEQDQ